jgi:hypothetical protein
VQIGEHLHPSAMTALPDSWYEEVGAAPELGWALTVMRGSVPEGRLEWVPCFSLRRHRTITRKFGRLSRVNRNRPGCDTESVAVPAG